VNQCGNVNKSVAALTGPGVEFVVVHDHFLTPTAQYADIVLPATTSWERNDIHLPWSGAGHYAIFMRQAIPPVGECRNDLDICAELARRLGLAGYGNRTEEEWLRAFCADSDIDDFDAFREQGLARLPAPADAVAFAREVREPERHPFSTPSGKIELYSPGLAAHPDPYGLGPIPPIPTWIPSPETDSRWPLELVSPKSRARTHSTHDNQPVLARADRQDVWIHPDDASRRGIADGATVRVFNDRGSTVVPAHVTDRITPGVVSIKEGAWFTPARRAGHARLPERPDGADRSSPAGATTPTPAASRSSPPSPRGHRRRASSRYRPPAWASRRGGLRHCPIVDRPRPAPPAPGRPSDAGSGVPWRCLKTTTRESGPSWPPGPSVAPRRSSPALRREEQALVAVHPPHEVERPRRRGRRPPTSRVARSARRIKKSANASPP
jgi:anaerobic selenocysteine-containing dehydrogenase